MNIYCLKKEKIISTNFNESRFKGLKELYNKRKSNKISETINSTLEITYYEENNEEVREVNINSYERYEKLRLTPINSNNEGSSNITQFIGNYETLIDSHLVYLINEWAEDYIVDDSDLKKDKIEKRKEYLCSLREIMSKEEFKNFKKYHVKPLN